MVLFDPVGAAPTVSVGVNPVGVAVDSSTRTVYVANTGGSTVSVIDAGRCNAGDPKGCRQPPAAVAVGGAPLAVTVDRPERTAYVSNLGDATVSMIDTGACNAAHAAGCGQAPPTVSVGGSPGLSAVDPATGTVYVPDFDDGTVSMIDGATCNATHLTGCAATATVAVGSGPQAVAIDRATHTAFVANFNDGTVSLIDTATCNATHHGGCGATPATVAVGEGADALVVDGPSHTVYVAVGPPERLGALAMIDGATCNARATAGCARTTRRTAASR